MRKEMLYIDCEYVGYTFNGIETEEEIQKIMKELSEVDNKIKRETSKKAYFKKKKQSLQHFSNLFDYKE